MEWEERGGTRKVLHGNRKGVSVHTLEAVWEFKRPQTRLHGMGMDWNGMGGKRRNSSGRGVHAGIRCCTRSSLASKKPCIELERGHALEGVWGIHVKYPHTKLHGIGMYWNGTGVGLLVEVSLLY